MGGHVIETETMILYRTAMNEGRMLQLIESICKKIHKNKSPEQIAEELEETQEKIKTIYDVAMKSAPDFDAEKIYQELQNGRVVTE